MSVTVACDCGSSDFISNNDGESSVEEVSQGFICCSCERRYMVLFAPIGFEEVE